MTFKVRHLGLRDYRAGFAEIDATLDAGAGTLEPSSRQEPGPNNPVIRERMLSDEFLDAARFPDVRWVVSEFRGDESRAIAVTGDLTIHGHTQPVEAIGRIGLPGPGLLSPENRVGIELTAVVDRRDFGLTGRRSFRPAATRWATMSRSKRSGVRRGRVAATRLRAEWK